MKSLPRLCLLSLIFCGSSTLLATDITTLSGKKYLDVHDVQVRGKLLTFTTDTDIVKIPLTDLPLDIRQRYSPKATPTPIPAALPDSAVAPSVPPTTAVAPAKTPFPTNPHDLVVSTGNRYLSQMAADLQAAQTSPPRTYTLADAFSVPKLDEASKDALINGRPVAFFIVDDTLLNTPCVASEVGKPGAFTHFFQTFARSVTPVFVFPARDLAKLPGPITIALGKPAAIPSPRVIFTNSDLSEVLYDLTLGTAKQSFAMRNESIYPAVGMIKLWYVKVANSLPSK